jgi:hypothetical protein|tara:strand:+ start:12271 stop:12765 length:495 start_codon:yes stop_codon:yes gene_type:complete
MKKLKNLKPGDLVKYIGGGTSKYLIKGNYYEFKGYKETDVRGATYDKIYVRDGSGKFCNKPRTWFEIDVPDDFFYTTFWGGKSLKTKVKTPNYYNGDYGYTAKQVVDNFNLPYHLGTAVTYILRAYKKHNTPNEDIQKAIDHLTFELEKLQRTVEHDNIISGTE